ncbi:tRNA (guanosine(37)-N1)-methyltransferase TrmD [Lacrimispora saccharolytica]|uniref:tRNA (guanosine(37)-N1)-methyltransferase TrmD n=1 Tax=Lacrimispora saccharolytica TaxID=84030 RepID=UPI00265D45CE|nr:tRNA (guanosine(37)-N1)-methyltransferase TrmD [Lacrimispora saccharolytica]MCF2656114.1 tRNA (guanosine(37)-N1)-methyltransferase TrmD [Lacrimispora saccharolytica]
MNYHIMTLFPDMIDMAAHTSIMGRAIANGSISLNIYNIRDYTLNKNKRVDDYTYGGGAGMLMQAQPIYDCYRAVCENIYKANPEVSGKKIRTVYLTPQAKVFNQGMAMEMSDEEDIIFLCGHYEGVDERVLEEIVTDYISIGDYVLTGGELPALIIMDAISRMVPGVLGNDESAKTESFDNGLLEYPQYSRPEEWMGKRVPDVLLSGHHANIEKWRRTQSELRTKERRPDLYEKYLATKETV